MKAQESEQKLLETVGSRHLREGNSTEFPVLQFFT